jgi:hypothetical protein
VLARALAKAPESRYASAAEMATAIARWPTEGFTRARVPIVATEPAATAVAEPTTEHELGTTPDGRLLLRHDTRTARLVLVEERKQPLDDAALADIRRRAAAGGPWVQRVLRLDPARREIWYEALTGEVVALESATPAERHHLDAARAAASDVPFTHFARTDSGPALLVAPLPKHPPSS